MNGSPVSSGPVNKFRQSTILDVKKFIILTALAGGGIIAFVAINSSPENLRDPISGDVAVSKNLEEFNRNARRVGGTAFPAPVIESDIIARLPPTKSSYANRQQKLDALEFMMPRPEVIDISTIRSGNRKITIDAIVAVPVDKICRRNGMLIPCGRMARTALRALIRGRTLTCRKSRASGNSIENLASCKVGKTDITRWLVDQGWTRFSR